MNYEWFVSLATALMTSVLGTGAVSPEENSVSREILSEKVSPSATEADLVREFNGILKDEFVPREKLSDLAQKPLTKKVFIQELLKKVEKKLPQNFVYPPLIKTIKFRDISDDNPIFSPAQKLRALEILPVNNGFFGQPNNQNPVMKISEVRQILQRAFDKNGKLNYLQDKDLDGVPNALDACPDLPAKKTGCPQIPNKDKFPYDTVLKVADEVKVVDEKEIQIGDKFSAVIFDPVSEEIFAQSEFLTVTK